LQKGEKNRKHVTCEHKFKKPAELHLAVTDTFSVGTETGKSIDKKEKRSRTRGKEGLHKKTRRLLAKGPVLT